MSHFKRIEASYEPESLDHILIDCEEVAISTIWTLLEGDWIMNHEVLVGIKLTRSPP